MLEEGVFDLDKHGKHWTIPTPTTIIATANPIQSKWAGPDTVSNDEISMLKTLLDRFQQIYIFRDKMDDNQRNAFVNTLSKTRRSKRQHNYNFLRKYLVYASSIQIKRVTHEAEFMLNEFWNSGKKQETLTNRDYIAIFNIANAQAKLQLKDIVDEEIAEQTMEIFNLMRSHYGEVIKTIINPKIVTYNRFLDILQDNKAGVSIRELCREHVMKSTDKRIPWY